MLLLSSLLLLISVVTAAVCVTGKKFFSEGSISLRRRFFSAGSAGVGNFLAQAQPA
jgi:hypothetical protein